MAHWCVAVVGLTILQETKGNKGQKQETLCGTASVQVIRSQPQTNVWKHCIEFPYCLQGMVREREAEHFTEEHCGLSGISLPLEWAVDQLENLPCSQPFWKAAM